MTNQTVYSYGNDQALEDGFFADVTPPSVKSRGGMRWIVTDAVYKEFSLAAIAEMYNEFVKAIRKSATGWDNSEPFVTKMNGKVLWCFLENEPTNGRTFKIIFPSEY